MHGYRGHDRSEIYRSGYKNFGLPRRHRPLVRVTPHVIETYPEGRPWRRKGVRLLNIPFFFFVLVVLHTVPAGRLGPPLASYTLAVAFVSLYTPAIIRRSCRSRERETKCPLE